MVRRTSSRAVALIIFVAFFSTAPTSTVADPRTTKELATLNGQVSALFQSGRNAEAIEVAKRAVAIAERGVDSNPEVATAFNNLAELYRAQDRYAEAEPLFKRSLTAYEKALGPNHPNIATASLNLARLVANQARYSEAELLYKRALTIREKALGPNSHEVATVLDELAMLMHDEARYSEAEPLFKRSLATLEKALGPNDPEVSTVLNNLSLLYKDLGRYSEAETLVMRSLAIGEKTLGPEHSEFGTKLNNLAEIYRAEGRGVEAEALYKRSLAIKEKVFGPNHRDVATALNNLAELYNETGRYAEAERLYKRSLSTNEENFGADHPAFGQSLNNLATLYYRQGRYADAEPLMRRAFAIEEKTLGPEHPEVARTLNNLALLLQTEGHYSEAEPIYKRALATDEKALGPDHPNVAVDLNNLGDLYRLQHRYPEAVPLLARAFAITEKALGPAHPLFGVRVNNLALLYETASLHNEAEQLYKRALAIAETTGGPEHPDVGLGLSNLALVYDHQGRYAESEPLHKRAVAIAEKAVGPDSPDVAIRINNLAQLYYAQGRYNEAEPLMQRALAITEKALGPDHPSVGLQLNNLGALYFAQSNWDSALDFLRRGTALIERRTLMSRRDVGQALTGKTTSEALQSALAFSVTVKAANRLAPDKRNDPALLRDMFQTAQWSESSQAADSLAQMAARSAKGNAKLAALVRERQDLVAEWQGRDQTRSVAVSQAPDKRNPDAEAENVARLTAIDARIVVIDKDLAENFPDYAALTSPAPLSAEEVQAQLGTDEALVLFLGTSERTPTPEETFVWIVTKTDMRWVRSGLGTAALTREVSALRCGLDYDGAAFLRGGRCSDLLKMSYTAFDHALGKPLPFDLARSYALYKALFGDVEDLIKDRRLLIVPSGPLTQLPFQVLVTKPPHTALPASAADYRDVAWLVREHAITVLPAVSSLKEVRELAKESHASEKYIGFGNPLLDGNTDNIADQETTAKTLAAAKLARDARCEPVQQLQTAALADLPEGSGRVTRGPDGLADLGDLHKLAPLPETAEEVCGVANILGVDPRTHVFIGAEAREKTVKRLSNEGQLAKYKIVHFATHGALAGQLSPAAEPGLILTPPDKASEVDDGYLSASEVAALRLDADWVILSACNTAAGDARSAEALSGLARAFFYAGSRSLLVSHWYVASKTTVPLITTAIAMLTVDPKTGRAEALRRSMLSIIANGKSNEAHPAFWAPFVLVGEGGAGH